MLDNAIGNKQFEKYSFYNTFFFETNAYKEHQNL